MGVAGLLGAVLGPSPLVLPFVPLISLAHVPFALAMGAVGLPGGLAELGIAAKAVFVVWSAVLGGVAGGLIGLLMLMVVRRGAIREFLRRIAEALHDEWQRPR